jgi:hypothetical protein
MCVKQSLTLLEAQAYRLRVFESREPRRIFVHKRGLRSDEKGKKLEKVT